LSCSPAAETVSRSPDPPPEDPQQVAAPSEAQRSDLQAGQFAKRVLFTRSVKDTAPAIHVPQPDALRREPGKCRPKVEMRYVALLLRSLTPAACPSPEYGCGSEQ
jgi:hypothetical protein